MFNKKAIQRIRDNHDELHQEVSRMREVLSGVRAQVGGFNGAPAKYCGKSPHHDRLHDIEEKLDAITAHLGIDFAYTKPAKLIAVKL